MNLVASLQNEMTGVYLCTTNVSCLRSSEREGKVLGRTVSFLFVIQRLKITKRMSILFMSFTTKTVLRCRLFYLLDGLQNRPKVNKTTLSRFSKILFKISEFCRPLSFRVSVKRILSYTYLKTFYKRLKGIHTLKPFASVGLEER